MRALALLPTLMLAACGADLGPARFSAGDCRQVVLTDQETGQLVVGAEDIALLRGPDVLYVSAYDRLKDADGGVYEVPIRELLETDELSAKNISPWGKTHGIHVEGPTLRAIVREDGRAYFTERFELTIRSETDIEDEVAHQWTSLFEIHCNANEVAPVPDETIWIDTYVSVDGRNCDAGFLGRALKPSDGFVEQLTFDGYEGKVSYARAEVMSGLKLANGLAAWTDGVWVAEMRGKRIRRLSDGLTIDLPGAPDNLNTSNEGLIAALQPSLWRFGLYRYGYVDRAPTRVVRVLPETDEVELLLDDPQGELLSGATAAVLTGDGLMVASSVRGEHLLVCEAPS